jgi:hypothetical protein
LADAGMWSVPLVVIGGHAPMSQTGRGAVQDAPQLAIAEHVTKRAIACVDPARCNEESHRLRRSSAHIALRGRSTVPGASREARRGVLGPASGRHLRSCRPATRRPAHGLPHDSSDTCWGS